MTYIITSERSKRLAASRYKRYIGSVNDIQTAIYRLYRGAADRLLRSLVIMYVISYYINANLFRMSSEHICVIIQF